MNKPMTVVGRSRQAAFFGPTVANGALRTWLDLRLAPPSRECRDHFLKSHLQPPLC